MNLNAHYHYFPAALPPEFCDNIIEHAKNKSKTRATTRTKQTVTDLKKARDSNIVWLNESWIYHEILPMVHIANEKAGWNFDWDWSEDIQFTIYKKNQFYDWHCDSDPLPYDRPHDLNFHKKIRKLSVTCSLSDPKTYQGGELQFQLRNEKNPKTVLTCTEIAPKGSVVVFPSFIWHRIKPVTKGIRHSLVLWNLGYPYK